MVKSLGLRLICNVSDDICGYLQEAVDDDGEDVIDNSANKLSYVGKAAYEYLRTNHEKYHHQLWNVTSGRMVGTLHQTPLHAWLPREEEKKLNNNNNDDDDESNNENHKNENEFRMENQDLREGHDDWFPEKLGEIIGTTKKWCDVLSLGPPDGQFLSSFQTALKKIHERSMDSDQIIVVRMMFGNIPAMPVNVRKVIKKLRKGIPKDTKLRLWVGAWRKGVSWNHSKIIAVDGRHLWTGGHNLWDAHYLRNNPVHDLSFELTGRVANDGHRYANEQWSFIENSQDSVIGQIIDKLPDYLPLIMEVRVTVSAFPKKLATEFPPMFDHNSTKTPLIQKSEEDVPILTIGRYGSLLLKDRPSDDAFVAMLDSAQSVIRMGLQDLGPVCIPGSKVPLPGCVWPKKYLNALARVIWLKGVQVEIVLSNPGSVPGGLKVTEACYGNGWSCVDVASEIIKRIKKQFPEACSSCSSPSSSSPPTSSSSSPTTNEEKDSLLRTKVSNNLRVCFIREQCGSCWADGLSIAMHAKHFIIDDRCTYIGSQNLYVCDLAEWGVVIDDVDTTERIMEEYWRPMWKHSFTGEDCNVQEVMDGLNIERESEGDEGKQMSVEASTKLIQTPVDNGFFGQDDDDSDSDGDD